MYMKKKFSFFIFIIISTVVKSQFANNWQLGNTFGLNFSSSTPTLTSGSIPIGHVDNTSTISDASGNLLFYTNGIDVWDKTHSIMPNGSGLIGSLSAG